MLLIILISSIFVLFLFEEFRDLLTDIIFMLIICVFVLAYAVCYFIVDVLYVFIADYVLVFINNFFIRPIVYIFKIFFGKY